MFNFHSLASSESERRVFCMAMNFILIFHCFFLFQLPTSPRTNETRRANTGEFEKVSLATSKLKTQNSRQILIVEGWKVECWIIWKGCMERIRESGKFQLFQIWKVEWSEKFYICSFMNRESVLMEIIWILVAQNEKHEKLWDYFQCLQKSSENQISRKFSNFQ